MAEPMQNRVLDALLERLYAALARGPALNASPGNSRQRVDLATLDRIGGSPSTILAELLGEARSHRIRYNATPPPKSGTAADSDEVKAAQRSYDEGQKLLRKLATVAKEADTYQRDTGAAALFIGYPLLSLPETAARKGFGSSRLLAPLAFVPITLEVATGTRPGVVIASSAVNGSDRVIANVALKTWIERQIGTPYPGLFEDEEGADPLREVAELLAHVAECLEITNPPSIDGWPVQRVPDTKLLGTQASILACAVMGLFPISKQGAIRDLEDVRARPTLPETIRPFVSLDASLTAPADAPSGPDEVVTVGLLPAHDEHLVDWADPCQRRAVIRARTTRGLVVHGPPGTGKSQTITNIIGDCLARGRKVLLVCEKRTALDVVKYRLDARGLGALCTVVHDATSDRTALYTGVREQLDALADTAIPPDPGRDLDRVNKETDTIESELREYHARLADKDPDSDKDFHELMGLWLATAEESAFLSLELDPGLAQVRTQKILENEGILRSAYRRLIDSSLADNAWDNMVRLTLDEFLDCRMDELRARMDECLRLARVAAAKEAPSVPPPDPDVELQVQADWRKSMADELQRIQSYVATPISGGVAALSPEAVSEALQSLAGLEIQRNLVATTPLAPDLQQAFAASPLPPPQVASGIPVLATYLAKVNGFLGFFQFGVKKAAAAVLAPFGLPLERANVEKVKLFLEGTFARNILRGWLAERMPSGWAPERIDAALLRQIEDFRACADVLRRADIEPSGRGFGPLLRQALASGTTAMADALRESAAAILAWRDTITAIRYSTLFSESAVQGLGGKLLFGKRIDEDLAKLREDLERLEPLLRFQGETARFPPAVGSSLKLMARTDMDEESAWRRLVAGTIEGNLRRRLHANPLLLSMDATRIEGHFRRLRELTGQKQVLEAAMVQFIWLKRQKERLLAGTGSRLNSNGADLRRRLLLRGKQASRIRQVILEGRTIEGGDPLFDIHPVWMTSPETATLIFAAEKTFDAVIFDEASQCRLEEGLPVLLRGENIVIAGDTKQLPPTRFFESAVVSSDAGVEEDAGQEGLFQSQQAEIEDLLGASLNIEIEQSYLDVHYRSTNEDLIRFSNDSFYGSRLQAIPAHPNARATQPPIALHQVGGTYVERTNQKEAEFVVGRLRALLQLPEPPTIGIVSFNLSQKDLIEETLDAAADSDAVFREALTCARTRERKGGFEGLFVKNLENVQGDERDVIIISTTYGPTPEGKFHRRFGPLGQAGGERRLNVIVTRARERVEVVTSIPAAAFRSDANAAVPAGQRPNGAWFLMRYLRDAELLAGLYAREHDDHECESADTEVSNSTGCLVCPSGSPSQFVEAFAHLLLKEHGVASILYHGNDGFAVDLAFRHPDRNDRVTIGVLFDATRYRRAQDRVEWDGFKRAILHSQRWELHHVWTPQFLRDPRGTVARLLAAASQSAASDEWDADKSISEA